MYRKAKGTPSPETVREARFLALNEPEFFIHQAPARAAGRPPRLMHVPMHQPINARVDSKGYGVTVCHQATAD